MATSSRRRPKNLANLIARTKAKSINDFTGEVQSVFNLITLMVDIRYRIDTEKDALETKQLYNVTDKGLNKNERSD